MADWRHTHVKCCGTQRAKTLAVGVLRRLEAPTITSAPVPAAILISSTPSPKGMACCALAHMSFCRALVADWCRAHVNRLIRVEARSANLHCGTVNGNGAWNLSLSVFQTMSHFQTESSERLK